MATHSSTLAWRIPWREEPVRLQSMGSSYNVYKMINYTIQLENLIVYNLRVNCLDLHGTRNTVTIFFSSYERKEVLPTHGKTLEACAWESTYFFFCGKVGYNQYLWVE